MILFYALIICIIFAGKNRWVKIGVPLTILLVLVDVGYWIHKVQFNKDLQVTYIDVGQANSALVEFPGGKKMLIDGGGFAKDYFDVGKMVISPFLWSSKINTIDYIVLSHPQSDHMNGLRFIAKNFHPKEFWYNGDTVENIAFKELISIIEKEKIKTIIPSDLINGRIISGVKVDLLHPKPERPSSDLSKSIIKLNDNSLVLKLSFRDRAFLFPGDIEHAGEKALISSAGYHLKSDVLLSPHHGSSTSNSRNFIKFVQPKICVISCGEGNRFGFPHSVTLNKFTDTGCRIFRTDKSGAITITLKEDDFLIKTYLNGYNNN